MTNRVIPSAQAGKPVVVKAEPTPFPIQAPFIPTKSTVPLTKEIVATAMPESLLTPKQFISDPITLYGLETCSIMLPYGGEFPLYSVMVDDDSFMIDHHVRSLDEDKHMARLLLGNRSPEKRMVTIMWQ
jgi:hypothetical protein